MDGKKKLEELVAGLDGVTPGPWQTLGGTISDFGREWPCSLSMEFIPNGIGEDGVNERHEKDIAHIARCDPDTIRSISDAYKAMEAENERLRALIAAGDDAHRSIVKEADESDYYRPGESGYSRADEEWFFDMDGKP